MMARWRAKYSPAPTPEALNPLLRQEELHQPQRDEYQEEKCHTPSPKKRVKNTERALNAKKKRGEEEELLGCVKACLPHFPMGIPRLIVRLASRVSSFVVTVRADGYEAQEFRCVARTQFAEIFENEIYKKYGLARPGETPIYTPRRNGPLSTEIGREELVMITLRPSDEERGSDDRQMWRRGGQPWQPQASSIQRELSVPITLS